MSEKSRTELPRRIDIQNLSFYYGENRALKDVTVPLYERQVTAFIGPSGCGKSTLLRVLNRIYELYPNQRATGQVIFDGENILEGNNDANLLRTKIGMVFQKPTPFPMTIYDNIAYGIKLFETPAEIRNSTAAWKLRCGVPLSGTRSRTNCASRASAFPAVSSSGCA